MPTNDVTTPAVILAFTMSASLTSITPVKVAAVATLCQDARVFDAMMMAGTPCPYKGKIGLEAAEAWANDPEARPDYEKWLKENNLEKQEEEWNNAKETATGLGILGLLLLLL